VLRHTPEVGAVFGKPHAVPGTPSLGLNWLTDCRIAPPRSCLTFAISLSSARSWLLGDGCHLNHWNGANLSRSSAAQPLRGRAPRLRNSRAAGVLANESWPPLEGLRHGL